MLTINAVKDDSGEIIQCVGSFSDITYKPVSSHPGAEARGLNMHLSCRDRVAISRLEGGKNRWC